MKKKIIFSGFLLGVLGLLVFFILLSGYLYYEWYAINNNYSNLEDQLNNLNDDYNDLYYECIDLEEDYLNLYEECGTQSYLYDDLKGNVLYKGSEATIYFDLLDGSSHLVGYSAETLNYYVIEGNYNMLIIENYEKGYTEYSLATYFGSSRTNRFYHNGVFSPTIKLDNGEYVYNYMAFSDPDSVSVSTFSNYIKAHSSSDQEFIENIIYVKTQVNEYSYTIMGEPRYAMESFLEGGGDCGASSIFIGDMIKAAHPEWTVEFVVMDSNNPTSPISVDHAMIYVETTNGYGYHIETTADDIYTALHSYPQGVIGWIFEFE